jgi:anaerobic ribonucleoside-triphosphate reductase activating protein
VLIHSKMDITEVNGPGKRALIHVQGCTLNCKGCWNPDTHAWVGQEVEVTQLVDWVVNIPDIEGLTFSGGEPMQQAGSLLLMMLDLKELRPELSIGMYTGYTLKELETNRYQCFNSEGQLYPGNSYLWGRIKEHLDFAIMGRYVQAKRSQERPLCGSSNQEVVFFTDRYSEKDLSQQAFEVTIDRDTSLVHITGFPIGIDLNQL